MSDNMHKCKQCGLEKHDSQFHRHQSKNNTRDKKCKSCRSALNSNQKQRQMATLVTDAHRFSQKWLQTPQMNRGPNATT